MTSPTEPPIAYGSTHGDRTLFAANMTDVWVDANGFGFAREELNAGSFEINGVTMSIGLLDNAKWSRRERLRFRRAWVDADSLRTWLRRNHNQDGAGITQYMATERSHEWKLSDKGGDEIASQHCECAVPPSDCLNEVAIMHDGGHVDPCMVMLGVIGMCSMHQQQAMEILLGRMQFVRTK